jgi:hypothetical protein
MTDILTRSEYLRLAIQFDKRARSATNQGEPSIARALVFRRLAEARLPVSIPEGNFVRRSAARKGKKEQR